MYRIVSAGLGVVPVFESIFVEHTSLFLVSSFATLIAVLHAVIEVEDNETHVRNRILAVDSGVAVLLALYVGLRLRLHTTTVGFFRILWLIVLVLSSSSYSVLASIYGDDFPADVSLVAIAASVVVLVCISLVSRCFRRIRYDEDDSDIRHLIAEYALVCGALLLRFTDELQVYIRMDVGWPAWHLSAWCALSICGRLS